MGTVYTIVTILGMAAIVGMYLLSLVLRHKETPKGLSFIHGIFAVAGLLLLIYYTTCGNSSLTRSMIIFIIAAIGGIALIYRDITGNKVPSWLAIGHGLIAVTGFVFLIIDAFL
jgi:drug/metabolite transporter superfamily protein YnfA